MASTGFYFIIRSLTDNDRLCGRLRLDNEQKRKKSSSSSFRSFNPAMVSLARRNHLSDSLLRLRCDRIIEWIFQSIIMCIEKKRAQCMFPLRRSSRRRYYWLKDSRECEREASRFQLNNSCTVWSIALHTSMCIVVARSLLSCQLSNGAKKSYWSAFVTRWRASRLIPKNSSDPLRRAPAPVAHSSVPLLSPQPRQLIELYESCWTETNIWHSF